jgi:hypothetical protein
MFNQSFRAPACRAFFCIVLIAAPAFSRTVRGIVTDSNGRPVARAPVRLKNSITLKIRSQVTDKDGAYSFAGLNPRMDYDLLASHKGKSSGWVHLSRYDEGAERVVNLRLK